MVQYASTQTEIASDKQNFINNLLMPAAIALLGDLLKVSLGHSTLSLGAPRALDSQPGVLGARCIL